MAALILPNRFAQQPNSPSQVDRSHPLARNLSFAFNAGAGVYDAASGKMGVQSAGGGSLPLTVVGPGGVSRKYTSGSANEDYWPGISDASGVKSFACLFSYSSVPGVDGLFLKGGFNNGWGFKTNGSGQLRLIAAGSTVVTDATALVAGNVYLYVGVFSVTAGLGYLYRNGVAVGNNFQVGAGSTAGLNLAIGKDESVGTGSSANVYGAWVWDGELSANDVAAFSANPWQIFKSAPRRIWVEAIGAASTADGIGVIDATSTAEAAGASVAAGYGTIAGTSTAQGIIGLAEGSGIGSLAGDSTATAIATSIVSAESVLVGDSTATAVSTPPGSGTGVAAADADAVAVAASIAAGEPSLLGVATAIGQAALVYSGSGVLTGVADALAQANLISAGYGVIAASSSANGSAFGTKVPVSETWTGTPSFDGLIYSNYLAGNKPSGFVTAPRILGTDIVSGPLSGGEGNCGAYMTIFGYSFGGQLKMGTATGARVYFRNQSGDNTWHEVENYRSLLKSRTYARNQTMALTVQLGALGNPSAGSVLDMKVTVNGTDSNLMLGLFTVQPGRFFFVSLTGNDNTGLVNRIDRPFRYVQNCIVGTHTFTGIWDVTTPMGELGLQAGDTIVLRGGTWSDQLGFDGKFCRFRIHTGTVPNGVVGNGYIHFVAYPGPANGHAPEDVHYSDPAGGKGGFHGVNTAFLDQYGMWVSISNLRMECSATSVSDAAPINFQTGAHHWRVHNCELGPWPSTVNAKCGGIAGQGYDCVVRFNYIHDIDGSHVEQLNHGIYMGDAQGVCSKRWEVSYNWIVNIYAGSGIQWNNNAASDTFDGNSVHHNWVETVAKYGLNLANSITTATVYNNVIIDPGLNCLRFDINPSLTRVDVTHNTFVQKRSAGAYPVVMAQTASGLTSGVVNIQHNICVLQLGHNAGMNFTNYTVADTAVVLQQNLYYDFAALSTNLPSIDVSGIYGDPKFTNAATGDYTCQLSGAGHAACTLAEKLAVADDFYGMPRLVTGTSAPGASKNDIGAMQGVGV